jgi:hypothetical protein
MLYVWLVKVNDLCKEQGLTYLVFSSFDVAICLNVPFNGMVGWETMYAATPA